MNSRRSPSVLRHLLDSGSGGGLLLMTAAALALLVANSSLGPLYFEILHSGLGRLEVLHWINDGLMALFFLFVGLEIKREFLDGQLSTWPNRALPGIAAAGGAAAPALIYLVFNIGNSQTIRGWAIPAATDIAFALGVLSLLGSRIPVSLKVFLATLAIIDDLIAVVVIALFYTAGLNLLALGGAMVVLALLVGLNQLKVKRLTPYLALGGVLWWLILISGVHPTIAGVALAMTIPLHRSKAAVEKAGSPLHRLEHGLSPWVAYLIVPVFGFANAGVSFAGMDWRVLLQPITLGVAVGLFVGKQLGVFCAAALAIRLRLACLPVGASWLQLYGLALLCGIGFTMSLFIGLLAFLDPALQGEVKVGVLEGSLLSALCGVAVLSGARRRTGQPPACGS